MMRVVTNRARTLQQRACVFNCSVIISASFCLLFIWMRIAVGKQKKSQAQNFALLLFWFSPKSTHSLEQNHVLYCKKVSGITRSVLTQVSNGMEDNKRIPCSSAHLLYWMRMPLSKEWCLGRADSSVWAVVAPGLYHCGGSYPSWGLWKKLVLPFFSPPTSSVAE